MQLYIIIALTGALFATWIWGWNHWINNREMRKDYIEIRMHQNLVMTYYVEVARKNRELIRRYNKLKQAISHSFMPGWTMVKINDWMIMNDMEDFSFMQSTIEDKHVCDTTRHHESKILQTYNRKILNEYPTEEIKTPAEA